MRVTQPVPAYVLWFGLTGLSIARALARQGVEVFGLHDEPNEPATCTRLAKVKILPPVHADPRAWIDHLVAEGRRHAAQKPVLFPASDAHWLLIAQHRHELEPWFRFAMPQTEDPAAWMNKSFHYAGAENAGIPMPRTEYPRTMADVQRLSLKLRYPCLVKPLLSYLWIRAYNRKLSVATSAEALVGLCSDAMKRELPFAIQEFIPAADDEIFGVQAYLDARSTPLAACVVRKVRQFEPLFGSSCCSRSVHEPRALELGLRYAQSMGFHGIACVEFKLDPRSGEFVLMEINVRAPLMMAVSVDSGVNLPWIAYRDLCGMPAEPAPEPVLGRRVSVLARDLHAAKFQRGKGNLSLMRWVLETMRTRDMYWAIDDPRPGVHSLRTIYQHWREGRYRSLPGGFPSDEEWAALMSHRVRASGLPGPGAGGGSPPRRAYGSTGSMPSDRVA